MDRFISGTLVTNRWHDLYSQIKLFPGCPFRCLQHFQTLFGVGNVSEADARVGDPDTGRMLLFKRLMAGMFVARPKDLLELPPLERKVVEVHLSEPKDDVLKIEKLVKGAFGALTSFGRQVSCPSPQRLSLVLFGHLLGILLVRHYGKPETGVHLMVSKPHQKCWSCLREKTTSGIEPDAGVEPATLRLRVSRSTD
jgi:hypothetical protein